MYARLRIRGEDSENREQEVQKHGDVHRAGMLRNEEVEKWK